MILLLVLSVDSHMNLDEADDMIISSSESSDDNISGNWCFNSNGTVSAHTTTSMHNTSAMASVNKTCNAILGKFSFTTNVSQSKSGTSTSRSSKEGESVSDAEAKRKHAYAQDHTMSSENLDSSPLVFDKLRRTYYTVPHTDPVVITLCASKFYSFTSQTHATDLLPSLKLLLLKVTLLY